MYCDITQILYFKLIFTSPIPLVKLSLHFHKNFWLTSVCSLLLLQSFPWSQWLLQKAKLKVRFHFYAWFALHVLCSIYSIMITINHANLLNLHISIDLHVFIGNLKAWISPFHFLLNLILHFCLIFWE